MPPAERITDMHTCLMVDPRVKPHVSGGIEDIFGVEQL